MRADAGLSITLMRYISFSACAAAPAVGIYRSMITASNFFIRNFTATANAPSLHSPLGMPAPTVLTMRDILAGARFHLPTTPIFPAPPVTVPGAFLSKRATAGDI
jgi:hypothetical protein